LTAAIVITGAPGAGKSSVAQAFTTLLDNAGVEHGAIESEQLAWGTPWLADALVHEQLAALVRLQRGYGRRRFVVVATTETQEDLDSLLAAVGASRSFVVCLRAPGDVCAARVLAREPERWAGRPTAAPRKRSLASCWTPPSTAAGWRGEGAGGTVSSRSRAPAARDMDAFPRGRLVSRRRACAAREMERAAALAPRRLAQPQVRALVAAERGRR
jgi:hypothetical protein